MDIKKIVLVILSVIWMVAALFIITTFLSTKESGTYSATLEAYFDNTEPVGLYGRFENCYYVVAKINDNHYLLQFQVYTDWMQVIGSENFTLQIYKNPFFGTGQLRYNGTVVLIEQKLSDEEATNYMNAHLSFYNTSEREGTVID